ncbi:MAG: tetratricopeptide repeat protein [Planctomycetota bacterium]
MSVVVLGRAVCAPDEDPLQEEGSPSGEDPRRDEGDENPETPTAPKTSRRRRWIFRLLAMTLVPLLFLGTCEGGLRLVGYGYPTDFFLDRAYRIFVFGGSAAWGDPEPAFGFVRILEAMLEDRYPGVRFEVVNTAMTAINSHVVRVIAGDCASQDPDLFVVYMGNNEVVGPYGAGTVFAGYSPSLATIRRSIWAKSTRIGQLLESLLGSLSGSGDGPSEWGGLEMFLEQKVSAWDPRLESVRSHFRENLEAIFQSAIDGEARVVACTVATNARESAPFASLHGEGLKPTSLERWTHLVEEGMELEDAGRHGPAVEKYREALAIDDRYADLHFRLGRCFGAMGRWDDARPHFLEAQETDALRFRADRAINRTIREAALGREKEGIYIADVAEILEAAEGTLHGIPGEEWFLEHVHFNFAGNHLVAGALFLRIEGLLPEWVRKNARAEGEPPSLAWCKKRLRLTGLNWYKIKWMTSEFTSRPPYTNKLDFPEKQAAREREMKALEREFYTPEAIQHALETYEKAVAEHPEDVYFARILALIHWEREEWELAIQGYASLLQQFPNVKLWNQESATCHLEYGNALLDRSMTEEALRQFHKALALARASESTALETRIRDKIAACRAGKPVRGKRGETGE